jgi:hypothetical protein
MFITEWNYETILIQQWLYWTKYAHLSPGSYHLHCGWGGL